jgi:hypothetical protein
MQELLAFTFGQISLLCFSNAPTANMAYVGNIAQPKFYAVLIGDFFNRVEHVKTCRILTRLTRFTGFILTT